MAALDPFGEERSAHPGPHFACRGCVVVAAKHPCQPHQLAGLNAAPLLSAGVCGGAGPALCAADCEVRHERTTVWLVRLCADFSECEIPLEPGAGAGARAALCWPSSGATHAKQRPALCALPCRYGRGRTVAYDLSRALNALHAKASRPPFLLLPAPLPASLRRTVSGRLWFI